MPRSVFIQFFTTTSLFFDSPEQFFSFVVKRHFSARSVLFSSCPHLDIFLVHLALVPITLPFIFALLCTFRLVYTIVAPVLHIYLDRPKRLISQVINLNNEKYHGLHSTKYVLDTLGDPQLEHRPRRPYRPSCTTLSVASAVDCVPYPINGIALS